MKIKKILPFIFLFISSITMAQEPQRGSMCGFVYSTKDSVALQNVEFELAGYTLSQPSRSYDTGYFILLNVPYGNYQMKVSCPDFEPLRIPVKVNSRLVKLENIYLRPTKLKYAIIRGQVCSALDKSSLFGASVVNAKTNLGVYCKENGLFILPDVPYGIRELKVSYLGYTAKKITVEVNNDTVYLGKVYLQPDAKTLKEVVVKGEIPMMQQKGDTIQYNAAAFKTRPEATALDLAGKMPGVTTDQGGIKVQGKEVKKVYLNGSEFFSDDPVKALGYLPANSVSTIKVYDEASDKMTSTAGSNDRDELISAMNVQTIGNEKKMLLGNIKAAGGSSIGGNNLGLYQFNGSAVYKVPKHTLGVGATVNNLNSGAINEMSMPFSGISGGRGGNNPGLVKAWEGSYNYDDKKFKVNCQYSGSLSSTDRFSETQNSYYPQLTLFNSKEQYNTTNNVTNAYNHRGDITIRWNPNIKNSFRFRPSFSVSNRNELNSTYGVTIQNGDTVSRSKNLSENENSSYSISNLFVWSHKFNKREREMELTTNYGVSGNNSKRTPLSVFNENYSVSTGKWISTNLSSDRLLKGNNKNNTFNSSFRFTEPLTSLDPKVTKKILYSFGIKRDWGSSNNLAYRFNSTELLYNKPDSATSNIYDKDYNSFNGKIGYSYQESSKLLYSLNMDLIRYDRKRFDYIPLDIKTNHVTNSVQPYLSLSYKNKYSFNYSGSALLPDIQRLTPYINDVNPMNLTVGNPNLKNGYSHQITFGYKFNKGLAIFMNKSNNRDLNKMTSFYSKSYIFSTFNLTASAETNPISVNRISLPVNRDTVIYISDNPKDTVGNGYHPQRGALLNKYVNLGSRYNIGVNANLDFSVPLTKNVVKLMAMYNYSNATSLYQSKLNKQNGHTFNLNTTITSYAWENVDYTITSNSNFGYTNNTVLSDNKYFNESLFATISVVLPKDFIAETNFNWLYSKSFLPESPKSTVGLLNFNVGKLFLKNRNLKVTLNGYDLLNQSKNRMQVITNDYIVNTRSNTFGRYVMLKLSYNFNSLKRASQDELRQKYFEDNKMNNLQPINNPLKTGF